MRRGAAYAFSRLLSKISFLQPSFQLMSPLAGFVSSDELNLLTGLRRASLANVTNEQPLIELDFAAILSLGDLLSIAGRFLRAAGIVLSPRPLLPDAIDVHEIALRDPPTDPSCTFRPVHVSSSLLIAPKVRRLLLTGSALKELAPHKPAQWIELFSEKSLPDTAVGSNSEPYLSGRVYTVREFNPTACTIAIDVFLRETGAMSQQLDTAKSGDRFVITGTHGGFAGVPADCEEFALAGDETAMPAIASILDSLPDHITTQLFIDIEDEASVTSCSPDQVRPFERILRHANCHLVPGRLASTLTAWASHHPGAYIWAAGEANEMDEVKRTLQSGPKLDARRVHTRGYWRSSAMTFGSPRSQ
ncbi:siderophore-interacting protein [Caballeronia sp. LZ043]|uniref:siderophore-interacting protein n=1 Tax=Caballeronia sp. LZ043 TaxID=3038569 RepID=UPI00286D5BFA|nr:siderophore-interacting protein [Caballeronia sp. LZ043]